MRQVKEAAKATAETEAPKPDPAETLKRIRRGDRYKNDDVNS